MNSDPNSLGGSIRALRRGRGLSGRELARLAGVSPAYLSRLERDRLSPTVSTLSRVMQALGEPVASVFLGGNENTSPVVRRASRRVMHHRGVVDYLLTPTRTGRLEVLETVIEPAGGSGEPYTHPGDEESVLVLDGLLRFYLDEKRYDLEPEDAITFSCRIPHRWENPGPNPTRAIWIITPAGY